LGGRHSVLRIPYSLRAARMTSLSAWLFSVSPLPDPSASAFMARHTPDINKTKQVNHSSLSIHPSIYPSIHTHTYMLTHIAHARGAKRERGREAFIHSLSDTSRHASRRTRHTYRSVCVQRHTPDRPVCATIAAMSVLPRPVHPSSAGRQAVRGQNEQTGT